MGFFSDPGVAIILCFPPFVGAGIVVFHRRDNGDIKNCQQNTQDSFHRNSSVSISKCLKFFQGRTGRFPFRTLGMRQLFQGGTAFRAMQQTQARYRRKAQR